MSAGTSASLCCGLLSACVLLVSAGESEQGLEQETSSFHKCVCNC